MQTLIERATKAAAIAAQDEADRIAATDAVRAAKAARTLINKRAYASRIAAQQAQQDVDRAAGKLK